MLDLFQVKSYKEYDFIQDTLPTADGTWLCSLTAGLYTRGYSYQVTSGTAVRIEEVQDLRIQDSIYSTLENTLEYLNNYFYIPRQTQEKYTYGYRFEEDYVPYPPQRWDINKFESDSAFYDFNGTNLTVDNIEEDVFQVGDYVRVHYAKRNNLMATVTAKTATQLTLDNDELRTTEENASIFLCDIPKAVEHLVAQMINFDVFNREVTDLDSETVGNYSYSKSKPVNGMLDYPVSIMSRLDIYKKVEFV